MNLILILFELILKIWKRHTFVQVVINTIPSNNQKKSKNLVQLLHMWGEHNLYLDFLICLGINQHLIHEFIQFQEILKVKEQLLFIKIKNLNLSQSQLFLSNSPKQRDLKQIFPIKNNKHFVTKKHQTLGFWNRARTNQLLFKHL